MAEERQRRAQITNLQRYLNQVNDHVNTPLDIHVAEVILEQATTAVTRAYAAQQILQNNCTDDAALDVQVAAYVPVDETYQLVKSKIKAIIASLQASAQAATPIAPAQAKLPKIEIPSFSGAIQDWPSFKDLFEATINNNNTLAPAVKLQYLKTFLKDEPAKLIKSLSTTDSNYSEAWSILKERYDNERELVFSLTKKIIHMKPVHTENPVALQALLDGFTEALCALQVLKQPTDQWDTLLIIILMDKIDAATLREWSIRNSGTKVPTYKEFTDFIHTYVRGLQAACSKPQQQKKSKCVNSYFASPSSSSSAQCIACQASHPLYKCSTFCSKSPNQRIALVEENNYCLNCLSTHPTTACRSKGRCYKCNEMHHTLLHVEQQAPLQSSSTTPSSSETVTSNYVQVNKHVLLTTAVVHVVDAAGAPHQCRVLLDSGGTASFISESCAQRLQLRRDLSTLNVTGIGGQPGGTTKGKVGMSLHNRFTNKFCARIQAHVMPELTGDLPAQVVNRNWAHLANLRMADPNYNQPAPIDIIIGSDYCARLMRSGWRKGPTNAPFAQKTVFGWVASGPVMVDKPAAMESCHLMITTTSKPHHLQSLRQQPLPPRIGDAETTEFDCDKQIKVLGVHENPYDDDLRLDPIPIIASNKLAKNSIREDQIKQPWRNRPTWPSQSISISPPPQLFKINIEELAHEVAAVQKQRTGTGTPERRFFSLEVMRWFGACFLILLYA